MPAVATKWLLLHSFPFLALFFSSGKL